MKKLLINFLDRFNLLVLANNFYRRLAYGLNFSLRRQNNNFTARGAPDGWPVPPPFLIFMVTGHPTVIPYYESGQIGAKRIKEILAKNNYRLEDFGQVLDFGCGVGRTLRHFSKTTGPKFFCSDYNLKLINWCKKNLTFAEFSVNQLNKPLDYPDNKFDFLYAISVFTHLFQELEDFWLQELRRILKPGGLAYITVQGTTRYDKLTETEKKKFDAGEVVTRFGRYQGSNICGAYHSEKYLRQNWSRYFEIIDFVPAGAKDSNQDVILLKK